MPPELVNTVDVCALLTQAFDRRVRSAAKEWRDQGNAAAGALRREVGQAADEQTPSPAAGAGANGYLRHRGSVER